MPDEIPAAVNVDEAADFIDTKNIFGQHDDTSEETPTETEAATDEAQPTAEPAEEAPAETPAAEDATPEERALSLESIAEQLDVPVDTLYGLELTTKVDGEEGKATLKDLQKSYQLQGHLTKESARLKADAETREKAWADEKQTRSQAVEGILSVARAELMGDLNKVDWEKLRAEDPEAYSTTFIDFQRREAQINTAIDQFNQQKQEELSGQQTEFQTWVGEQETAMTDLIPVWSNAETKKAEQEQMKSFLASNAFTKQEIAGIYDARQVAVVRKAMLWDQLQAKKPAVTKKVKAAPKAVKTGNSAPAKDSAGKEAMEAARKTAMTGRSNAREIADILASRGIL